MPAHIADDDSPTRPLSGSRRRSPRRAAVLFWAWCPSLVPAGLATAVGLIGLGTPEPGTREVVTRASAALGPAGILELARQSDAMNAPYYLLMHYWTAAAGDSITTLRIPSLVAVVLATALTGELGRRILGPGIGLCAGLMLAVLPITSRYAQDATPYALALLFATAATLLLYRTLDRPRWWAWTGYGLFVALTGLMHVPALLMLAGHAYTVSSRWRLSRQPSLFWWLPVTVLSLVPPAPLISLGVRQRTASLTWRPATDWDAALLAPGALTGSAAAGLLVIGLAFAARWPDRALIRELGVLAAAPPLLLIGASFLTGPLWAPFHVLFVLPPITLCAAVALRGLRLRAVLAIALVAALGVPQQRAIRQPEGHRTPAATAP
ncbi:glycosyltransferase family 39 protein [Actinoplanes sp. GCM10030250]|uniref:glycosyltransferase family 39 protein n=1 Tax=Actinoplanes sp. GCM10030250 TaxID=3273376 RepID=UPI003610B86E